MNFVHGCVFPVPYHCKHVKIQHDYNIITLTPCLVLLLSPAKLLQLFPGKVTGTRRYLFIQVTRQFLLEVFAEWNRERIFITHIALIRLISRFHRRHHHDLCYYCGRRKTCHLVSYRVRAINSTF